MTTAITALQELAREIDRIFPADGGPRLVLAQPLGELRSLIEASGGEPCDAGPQLDLIEDLIESQLRARGWPATPR